MSFFTSEHLSQLFIILHKLTIKLDSLRFLKSRFLNLSNPKAQTFSTTIANARPCAFLIFDGNGKPQHFLQIGFLPVILFFLFDDHTEIGDIAFLFL